MVSLTNQERTGDIPSIKEEPFDTALHSLYEKAKAKKTVKDDDDWYSRDRAYRVG